LEKNKIRSYTFLIDLVHHPMRNLVILDDTKLEFDVQLSLLELEIDICFEMEKMSIARKTFIVIY
jgi:hypothetical protein